MDFFVSWLGNLDKKVKTDLAIPLARDNVLFFNWDSHHTRLNSHYEAWSYKKRSIKKITGYRKYVWKEPTVKRCLLIQDLKPLRS